MRSVNIDSIEKLDREALKLLLTNQAIILMILQPEKSNKGKGFEVVEKQLKTTNKLLRAYQQFEYYEGN